MTEQCRSLTAIAPTVSRILGLPNPREATDPPLTEVVGSLQDAERLAILAPDALGYWIWKKWQGEMPFLTGLTGKHLLCLRCVMPSVTPVNFATLVSGVGLETHAVRKFHHPFKCETLFDVVRRAGCRSAGFGQPGWTGSELLAREADIDGTSTANDDDTIVERILAVADADSPKFMIAQIGETDNALHDYGPSSPDVVPTLRATDERLRLLVEKLVSFGYGIMIVADHGQHDVSGREDGLRGIHGTDSDEDCLVPLTWVRPR